MIIKECSKCFEIILIDEEHINNKAKTAKKKKMNEEQLEILTDFIMNNGW